MGGGLAAATARLKAKGLNKGGGADDMNNVKAKHRGNHAVVGKVKNLEKIMGGGMMQKPMPLMGYKKGKMIMARGCKLGRKKATKIT